MGWTARMYERTKATPVQPWDRPPLTTTTRRLSLRVLQVEDALDILGRMLKRGFRPSSEVGGWVRGG